MTALTILYFLFVLLCVLIGEWELALEWGWPILLSIIGVIVFMRLDKKSQLKDIGLDSCSEGKGKAEYIIGMQRWERTGSLQTNSPRYVCYRYNSPNQNDFDWLVKYIGVTGSMWNSKNPNSQMFILLGSCYYRCDRVNSDYTVTQILSEPYSQEEIDRIEQRIAAYKAIQEQEKLQKMEADRKAIESNNVPFTQEKLVQTAKALAQEFNIGQCPDSHTDINLSEYKNMKKKMWDALNRGRVSLSKLEEFEELLDEYDELLDGVDEEISDLRDEIDDRRWDIEQLIS